jgi:prophage tail gpP-like protein
MVDSGSDGKLLANKFSLLLFETFFAKEARNRSDCQGKPLDCSVEVYWGLQCGLSGNQALHVVTQQPGIQKETADMATFQYALGKSCLT